MERVCFLLRVDPERLLRDDGLLVGYVETEDFEAAQRAMAATDVNDRWQSEMAGFFGERADEGLVRLEEVFHLD